MILRHLPVPLHSSPKPGRVLHDKNITSGQSRLNINHTRGQVSHLLKGQSLGQEGHNHAGRVFRWKKRFRERKPGGEGLSETKIAHDLKIQTIPNRKEIDCLTDGMIIEMEEKEVTRTKVGGRRRKRYFSRTAKANNGDQGAGEGPIRPVIINITSGETPPKATERVESAISRTYGDFDLVRPEPPPHPKSKQPIKNTIPHCIRKLGAIAVMTTVVTTTTVTPMARVLTTITASADNAQYPVRSMDSIHTNQPSLHHQKFPDVNGNDPVSVMDHVFDDSHGVKMQPKHRPNRYGTNTYSRRPWDLTKSKLREEPTALASQEIPTIVPIGNWDSSVSTDVKGNTERTLSHNIDLTKIPKRRFPKATNPPVSRAITGGFTPVVSNSGSTPERPSPAQQLVPARSPTILRAPTLPPEQSGPSAGLVPKPKLKPEIKDGFDVFKAPHLRTKPIRNGNPMEQVLSTRIKPCVPNIAVPKAVVSNVGVPVQTDASKAGMSVKIDAPRAGESVPKFLDTDVCLNPDPSNAGVSIPKIPNTTVSIAHISLKPRTSSIGITIPHKVDADFSVANISVHKAEATKTCIPNPNIAGTNISNDEVLSNLSNINASIANCSDVDISTVLPASPRLSKEKEQPAIGENGQAQFGWGNNYENLVAEGPIGDWDHHPLTAWDGKLGPVPAEWGIRPAFDHNCTDHLNFMDAWIEQNHAEALSNPVAIDTRDPGFRTGAALGAGENVLGKPIDSREHDTILPDDDFTKAKRHETSAYAQEMLKGRIREPGSKSRQVYKLEFSSKAERRAYQEALEKFEADINAAQQACYDPATNPHVPKANIYIRPVEDGDLRQVAEIYNHYVDHSVVVPEMTRLSDRQWLGRLTDCRESSYAFVVAVQLSPKGRVNNNRRTSKETICGFAYADDYGERENAWRYTCELQVYVGNWTLRKGVGKSLLDRMMAALDPHYHIRGGVRFYGGSDPLRYEAGGVRVVHKVVISLPYAARDENTLKWQKEWLSQWKFEQAGNLKGIGRKFDKVVNLATFIMETGSALPLGL